MKIVVTTVVRVEQTDGEETVLSRTTSHHAGDNPRFHRTEVRRALDSNRVTFNQTHHLGSDDPL